MPVFFAATSWTDMDYIAHTAARCEETYPKSPHVLESIGLRSGGGAQDNDIVAYKSGTPPTEFWTQFYISSAAGLSSQDVNIDVYVGSVIVGMYDGSVIRAAPRGGSYTELLTVLDNSVNKVDIYQRIDASGEIQVYINDNLEWTYTGDTTNTYSRLFGIVMLVDSTGSTDYYGNVSGIIMDTQSTLLSTLRQPTINGDGATVEWNGTYADIFNLTPDIKDGVGITANAADQTQQFTVGTTTIPVDHRVKAVVMSANYSLFSEDIGEIEVVYNGTVDHDIGSLTPNEFGVWTNEQFILSSDPDSLIRWEQAEINSLEFSFVTRAA